jgi:hypothetical protein
MPVSKKRGREASPAQCPSALNCTNFNCTSTAPASELNSTTFRIVINELFNLNYIGRLYKSNAKADSVPRGTRWLMLVVTRVELKAAKVGWQAFAFAFKF